MLLVFLLLCFGNIFTRGTQSNKEKRLLLNDPDAILAQLNALGSRVAAVESENAYLKTQLTNHKGGAVFTRWGRPDCPNHNNTALVYSGLAGGGAHDQKGGGTDYLCLPHDPDQGALSSTLTLQTSDSTAHLYGAEYQFSYKNVQLDDDVPCAVCIDNNAIASLMVPGKSSCPKDWRKQYDGLLCSNYYGHDGASEYSCLDSDPHYIDGRRNDNNGKLFYPAVSKCGSLQCPPYVDGANVRCVVCTK